MKYIAQTCSLLAGLISPLAVQAENISLNFYALGFRAGTITVNGNETTNRYAVKGAVTPTRLLKRIKDVGYTGSAKGTLKAGIMATTQYDGNARTGSRNSVVKMHWSGRKPVVDTYTPRRETRTYDITPAKQAGTIDLLTAAYGVFKSAPLDGLCATKYDMFDGRRRSHLTLGKPSVSGKIATCQGTYKRVAGFSPHNMQKKVTFPFTMHYEVQDDGTYRFRGFSADATFGKISARRR